MSDKQGLLDVLIIIQCVGIYNVSPLPSNL